MPANILNLPQYRVLQVEEADHDYHVTAEPVDVTAVCPHCQSDRLNSWGAREQAFRDLPRRGKRVSIHVGTRRLRCRACGKTFSQALPALAENRMMTDRLVKWIGQQSLKRTFTSLAEETGVVEGTIRNIFRDYISELEQAVRVETPSWIGIDGIHLVNKIRGVISDIRNEVIMDLLPNLDEGTVTKRLLRMPGQDKVQRVSMGLIASCRDAVTLALPQARIVVDRIHVVRMVNDAMEQARKGLRAELAPKQKRGLMHDRCVLLKREHELSDEERQSLDIWTKALPALGMAYRIKEGFHGLYEARTPEEALERHEAWRGSIPAEVAPFFSELNRVFEEWQPFILNYFEQPASGACAENLNSLIQAVSGLSRGYSFEAIRGRILSRVVELSGKRTST